MMNILWSKKVEQEPSDSIKKLDNQPYKKIWAVGGGKGGVGKSLIAANLGIMLSRQAEKVVLVDLDLGGANLHTCLGVELPQFTLSDFIERQVESLEQLIVPTQIKNLGLISGAQDILDIANLKYAQKQRFLSKLANLDADYVILDLGAGTSFNTLDFFLAADLGMITLVPEPTSIENVYRFIKSAFYRRLKTLESSMHIKKMIDSIMNQRVENGVHTPSDLLNQIELADPLVGQRIKDDMAKFAPKLIINMVRSQTDIELGFAVSSVCKKYFGIETDLLGYIEYDNLVWQSVRKKTPLLVEFPNSKLVSNFNKIFKRLLNPDIKFIREM
jgi:flagellar biosynthesis protein FlhG